ncbi:MAG: amidase [Gammaproteobacteria bacterium]|nr:amidase [Gammaproteobacteria bacterium]
MTDPCLLTAAELRGLVARRELSCREVLDAHIARIEAVNPSLNAIITKTYDLATELAGDLDRNPNRQGPLAGLPIAHKDLLPTKGIRTTYGSVLYVDHVPETDALIVERMRAAGAVVVGKTNVPEFGAGSQTFNRVFGATLNPYDTSKTCGGSSGGAAVALAARLLPIADGSDTGGSLRNPAAFCNVVGFRPSAGRVPSVLGDPWSDLSTAGPMARTVDDLALLFSVLAGPDPRVPNCLPEAGRSFRSVEPLELSTLRIAVTEDFGGLPVAGAIREAIAELRDTLAATGATVIDAAPDLTDARRIFHVLRATGFRRRFGPMSDAEKAQLKDTIRWNLDAGVELTVADYDWVYPARAALVARVAGFFADVDLLIGPTTQVQPFDVTTDWVREVAGKRMSTYIEWMESCSWITVTCCPALSLPAGFKNGLPVGAQLIAPLREDAFLLRAAKAVEAVTGYAAPSTRIRGLTAGTR